MEFRAAGPDDADRIVRFWHESGDSMGATDDAESVHRVAANAAAVLLLAEAEGAIIGTLLGAFDGWRGNLYRLVVHPDRRRKATTRSAGRAQGFTMTTVAHLQQINTALIARVLTTLGIRTWTISAASRPSSSSDTLRPASGRGPASAAFTSRPAS